MSDSTIAKYVIFLGLFIAAGCLFYNSIINDRDDEITSPAVTSNEQNTQVRIYGFVCNKDSELWERRREKIYVTQAVFIDGKLVHCTPDKNDSAIFDSGSYLMGREGYFVIDGVEYPRSEIFDRWDKSQLNL
ncbi:hypothetical protein PP677_003832 [Salmonella enterica]|nr:hypothetical protein [Salmonella enterica subsp. enterica serovar Okatie]EBI7260561.1 hypothetical protein [Salmonella enterica]ECV3919483.1 hypothetical protein [Salmonella enterica subsp. enterica serovar O rough]EIV1999665.1 hypothetical protein [Salmonella enterica subsp. enterica serovar Telelkebir]EBG2966203.1 hypothetical protein [Salmonella enterica subsp. enterica serovar Okatie]